MEEGEIRSGMVVAPASRRLTPGACFFPNRFFRCFPGAAAGALIFRSAVSS